MRLLMVVAALIIGSLGWSVMALYCIHPFAIAFVVGMFKISTPAINAFCTEKAAGKSSDYARAWLRGWRRKSRLKTTWPFVPMFCLYLLYVSLFHLMAISGMYYVLTGQAEKIDLVMWGIGLVNMPISVVTIYYLMKDPRRLWMLHRQYRTKPQTIETE